MDYWSNDLAYAITMVKQANKVKKFIFWLDVYYTIIWSGQILGKQKTLLL